ncbi:MAG TPA: hypothetical protein PLO56_07380 [Rhodothermales bacterium]|nr:hypothetical protein [Rhodothermales bacterium]
MKTSVIILLTTFTVVLVVSTLFANGLFDSIIKPDFDEKHVYTFATGDTVAVNARFVNFSWREARIDGVSSSCNIGDIKSPKIAKGKKGFFLKFKLFIPKQIGHYTDQLVFITDDNKSYFAGSVIKYNVINGQGGNKSLDLKLK